VVDPDDLGMVREHLEQALAALAALQDLERSHLDAEALALTGEPDE